MMLSFANGNGGHPCSPGVGTLERVSAKPAAVDSREVSIRAYRPADRGQIRALCCETGYFGGPVDRLFQDRELFADLFTNAYLDYQPQWALVAEAEGRVVGYLLGAVSSQFDLLLMRSGLVTTCKMLWRLGCGRYAGHPRSRQFVRWLLLDGFREQPRHPPKAAHLHFDLEKRFRGRGISRRLWEMYSEQLRRARIGCCYGAFFSSPWRRPETVYSRYGFEEFDRRRTTLFEPELLPVDIVCVQKHL
jgi:GNAT superfamily N-acetyltransferase